MFSLLETLRLERGRFVRLERHLARLSAGAARVGYPWSPDAFARGVEAAATLADPATLVTSPDGFRVPAGVWRTRVLLAPDGTVTVEYRPFQPEDGRVWRVALAAAAVDRHDERLRLKTTERALYDRARATRPDVDEVLLWNGEGEITEGTFTNVVVELDGVRVTPPVACGLLPGVFRGTLVESGVLRERVVTRDDLRRATGLWLINSLREWMPATLVD